MQRIEGSYRGGVPGGRRNYGLLLLTLFALGQWVSLVRALPAVYVGEWFITFAGRVCAVSVIPLIVATWWYTRSAGANLCDTARRWLFWLSLLVLLSCLHGFGLGLTAKYVIYDTLSFFTVVCFVILGSIPQAFFDIRRVWFWVLAVSIPVNIIALTDLSELSAQIQQGARIARDTVSYRTQNAMDVLPLCFAFSFGLSRWKRFVTSVGVVFAMLQQVMYQKRLETVFLLIVLMGVVWLWVQCRGSERRIVLRSVKSYFSSILTLGVCACVLLAAYIVPQMDSLIMRFSGQTDDVQFQKSFWMYSIFENERFQMVFDSLASLNAWELWLGRGMGGAVELVEVDPRQFEGTEAQRFLDTYYLEDYGFLGRRGFESGMAVPILKGGIVLFVVYYSGIWIALSRWRICWRSLEGRLSIWLATLLCLYSIYGGDFAFVAVFQMANGAACLGYCLSNNSSDRRDHNFRRIPRADGPSA